MKRIKSLDGLRGFAIILVMLHHTCLVRCGWLGVQLFFVLSGYLITKILLNNNHYTIHLYLKRFYLNRSLRIFPIYFLYLFFLLIVYHFFKKPTNFHNELPYLMSYTFNLVKSFKPIQSDFLVMHLWSLSVEEQFYLVWPFLIYYLRETKLKILVLSIIVLSPFLRYCLGRLLASEGIWGAGYILYLFTGTQLDSFALGAVIPIFELEKKLEKPLNWFSFSFCIFSLIGLINLISTISKFEIERNSIGYPMGITTNLQHVWSYSTANLLSFTLILLLVSEKKHWIKSIFKNRILTSIGLVSYSIYVFHMFLLFIFYKVLGRIGLSLNWATCLIYIIFVYIFSYVSYHIYELRFLRLKEKMS